MLAGKEAEVLALLGRQIEGHYDGASGLGALVENS
jgi:hypothetical protein